MQKNRKLLISVIVTAQMIQDSRKNAQPQAQAAPTPASTMLPVQNRLLQPNATTPISPRPAVPLAQVKPATAQAVVMGMPQGQHNLPMGMFPAQKGMAYAQVSPQFANRLNVAPAQGAVAPSMMSYLVSPTDAMPNLNQATMNATQQQQAMVFAVPPRAAQQQPPAAATKRK